jgi:hypothetical protein
LKKAKTHKSQFRWFENSEFHWFDAHKVQCRTRSGEHAALDRFAQEILDNGYRPLRVFRGDGPQARMLGVKASTYNEAFAALQGTEWQGEPVYGSQGWCSGPLEVEVSRSTVTRKKEELRPGGYERQLNLAVSPELLAKLDAELKRRGRDRGDSVDWERGNLIGEAVDLVCSPEGQALTEKRRFGSQRRQLDESTAALRALAQ